jgi:thioredoxin-like negative regulator of GroEL
MVSASILATVLAVAAAPDVTLFSFSADWCGACQSVKPVVQRLSQDGYPVREVNIDRERELVARFRVTSVPSFVLLVDGREVDRVAESASYARLAQMFDRVGYRRPVAPGGGGPAQPLVSVL